MNNWRKLDHLIMKYIIILGLIILGIANYQRLLDLGATFLKILSPLIIGGVLAYIVNVPMTFLEERVFNEHLPDEYQKFKRPIAILLSLIIIILVLTLVLNLVIPQLTRVAVETLAVVPSVFDSFKAWISNNEKLFPPLAEPIQNLNINWQSIVENAVNFVNGFTSSLIGTTVSTIGSFISILFDFLLSFMLMIYILASKEKLFSQFKRLTHIYLPARVNRGLLYVMRTAHESFSNFIGGQTTEALILGVLVTIGMFIFRFPYPTMIGAFTGVANIFPYVGALAAGAIGFILILPISAVQAAFFLLFIIILQQFESIVIYPRVVGGSVGLPALWVLIAITIGGGAYGMVGMLLAVPIASTLYRLIKADMRRRERRNIREKEGEVVEW